MWPFLINKVGYGIFGVTSLYLASRSLFKIMNNSSIFLFQMKSMILF